MATGSFITTLTDIQMDRHRNYTDFIPLAADKEGFDLNFPSLRLIPSCEYPESRASIYSSNVVILIFS